MGISLDSKEEGRSQHPSFLGLSRRNSVHRDTFRWFFWRYVKPHRNLSLLFRIEPSTALRTDRGKRPNLTEPVPPRTLALSWLTPSTRTVRDPTPDPQRLTANRRRSRWVHRPSTDIENGWWDSVFRPSFWHTHRTIINPRKECGPCNDCDFLLTTTVRTIKMGEPRTYRVNRELIKRFSVSGLI